FMDVHRHAELRSCLLGEPDVIAVPVREHDRIDLAAVAVAERQPAIELCVVRGCAAVDDRDTTAVLDEVPVDEIRAEAHYAVGDLHRIRVPREHPSAEVRETGPGGLRPAARPRV